MRTKKEYLKIYNHIFKQFNQFKEMAYPIISIGNNIKEIACIDTIKKIDKLNIKIHLTHNYTKKLENNENFKYKVEKSYKPYFNGLDIPINNDSLAIILFLHELGHLDLILLDKNSYDFKLSKIENIFISSIEMIKEDLSEELYELNFTELYADKFAYINFPRIYNNLKYNEMIN